MTTSDLSRAMTTTTPDTSREAIEDAECGHPRAVQLTGVESGETRCALGDLNDQLNDALKMEAEYKAALAAEREKEPK